jgi:hypothetical protein
MRSQSAVSEDACNESCEYYYEKAPPMEAVPVTVNGAAAFAGWGGRRTNGGRN